MARSKKPSGSDAKLTRLHALGDEPVTQATTSEAARLSRRCVEPHCGGGRQGYQT